MGVERERKFLVTGNFMDGVQSSRRIRQGYLCTDPERTVRVRIAGDEAFITVKGLSGENFLSRYEFEQKIPPADAEALLGLCKPGIIDKVRHCVPFGNHIWEVDVFLGENEGLTIAEIELASAGEPFEKPAWAGKEVTPDKRYYNAALSQTPYSQWKETEKEQ
ncbi:MAG: CYTH domain-containing protein [Bacteroidales bacterium]